MSCSLPMYNAGESDYTTKAKTKYRSNSTIHNTLICLTLTLARYTVLGYSYCMQL